MSLKRLLTEVKTQNELSYLCLKMNVDIDMLYGDTLRDIIISFFNLNRNRLNEIEEHLYAKHRFITPIYFSYSWKDDLHSNIEDCVETLFSEMETRQYVVRRDKDNLQYGASINAFMQELASSKLIAVFMSEKYFKSINCMFELYEIFRNSRFEDDEFRKHTILINVDGCSITTDSIISYWKKKKSTDGQESVFIQDLNYIMERLLSCIRDTKYLQSNDVENIINTINLKLDSII